MSEELPTEREKTDLEVHVEMCHMRYVGFGNALRRIEKVQWAIAVILLAGAISTSLALWTMLPKMIVG